MVIGPTYDKYLIGQRNNHKWCTGYKRCLHVLRKERYSTGQKRKEMWNVVLVYSRIMYVK